MAMDFQNYSARYGSEGPLKKLTKVDSYQLEMETDSVKAENSQANNEGYAQIDHAGHENEQDAFVMRKNARKYFAFNESEP